MGAGFWDIDDSTHEAGLGAQFVLGVLGTWDGITSDDESAKYFAAKSSNERTGLTYEQNLAGAQIALQGGALSKAASETASQVSAGVSEFASQIKTIAYVVAGLYAATLAYKILK
jgi:hypothetical protein